MTDEALIAKVRKLLNLADPSRGGTEAERDTAMRMAQKLMFQHDLELYEVTADNEDISGVTHTQVRVEGKTMQWQGMLLHYLGSPLAVKVVYAKHNIKLSTWTLVGTPDNIALVKELHATLVPWLRSAASIARRQAMPSNPNAFNRAFFDRAGRTIMVRLQSQRNHLAQSHVKGTDLVLARGAQNDRYAENLFGQLKESRSKGYSNREGHRHGLQAGLRADISPNKLSR